MAKKFIKAKRSFDPDFDNLKSSDDTDTAIYKTIEGANFVNITISENDTNKENLQQIGNEQNNQINKDKLEQAIQETELRQFLLQSNVVCMQPQAQVEQSHNQTLVPPSNTISVEDADFVVEYIIPTRPQGKMTHKRKLLESLQAGEGDSVVKLKKIKSEDEKLDLDCEWNDCCHNDASWFPFMEHVRCHIQDVDIRPAENLSEQDLFCCLWEDCGFESNNSKEMVRHINYHSFHTKLKCLGLNMIQSQGIRACTLDSQERNLLHDFAESFKCKWSYCPEGEVDFEHPQLYYWHVNSHANNESKSDCKWGDCTKRGFSSRTRLREHLRSHTQEKQCACPTCGALFATRVKLFDHLKRQQDSSANWTCTNCNKTFALERLLRDHMRSHINTYECRECGMCWPTPSALQTHIMYRHSEERGFACEECEYKAKSTQDLKQHARTHQSEVLSCMEGCGFSCTSNAVMKNHFLKVHVKNPHKYACHLCEAVYGRGTVLTNHLKKKHKITSATSRFRYSLDEVTGLYRAQLYRFEMQEEEEGNLEIDTEVESVYQASPAPSTNSSHRYPSPAPTLVPMSSVSTGQASSVRSQGRSESSVQSQRSIDDVSYYTTEELGYNYPGSVGEENVNTVDQIIYQKISGSDRVEIDITQTEFAVSR